MSEERILAEIEDYKRLATNVYELAKEIHEQLDGLDEQEDMLKALKNMLELLFDLRRDATYGMMALMRCINTLEEKE